MAAYRERSNASANEATGPPGAGHIQHHVRPTGNLHRTLNSNSTARGTYTSGRRDIDAVSSIQGPETPGAERLGWIDEEYFENNPWYDQVKRKPVFSLGGPLPRLARGPRRPKHPRRHAHEDLAERGEAPIEEDEELAAARRSPTNDTQDNSQDRPATHTASGTGHGGGQNAAGQDVFNYTPGQTDSHQADAHAPAAEDDSPEYKIDGEPLGKREAYDGEEDGEDHDPNEYRNWWARVRAKHPEPLAEFLATLVAIFMGLSGSLSVYLSQGQSIPYGSYETSCWAWGFAWMFGVYLGGGVSGAHMNPAISISLSIFRGFPWRQCAIYVVVQFVAAIVAGALAYGCFFDTIHHVDPTLENASMAFLSTPQTWVSPGSAFLNQLVGSAVMMIIVFALGDDQNNPPGAGMHAFVLGLLVTTLKMTLGFNIGSALNPASDFGPRVIAYAIGYKQDSVFMDPWWFYGPWVATLVGSFIGCTIYDSFIFVGSESPINYRYPPTIRKKMKKTGRKVINKIRKSGGA